MNDEIQAMVVAGAFIPVAVGLDLNIILIVIVFGALTTMITYRMIKRRGRK